MTACQHVILPVSQVPGFVARWQHIHIISSLAPNLKIKFKLISLDKFSSAFLCTPRSNLEQVKLNFSTFFSNNLLKKCYGPGIFRCPQVKQRLVQFTSFEARKCWSPSTLQISSCKSCKTNGS